MANKEEQLQDILNKCIGKGWKPRFLCKDSSNPTLHVDSERLKYQRQFDSGEYGYKYYSYHDIFSKDSGFMEAVEWKISPDVDEDIKEIGNMLVDFIMEGKGNGDKKEGYINNAYSMMAKMTTEQKIDYVLENVAL